MITPSSSYTFDVAVIGFGFSGLSVLAHLGRVAPSATVAIIADDLSGRGLAYSTRDAGHLLNVPARKMGMWAEEPGDFARWLTSGEARAAARRLEVEVPGPDAFAPRALFAEYLTSLRRDVLHADSARVQLVRGHARSLTATETGWRIGGDVTVDARCCVLATGHDPRRVFGELRHPDLHDGPWRLPEVAPEDGPAVCIGTGLTAVDAVLTLRRRGYRGQIVALSRNGHLPAVHTRTPSGHGLVETEVERLGSAAQIVAFIRRGDPRGDWRDAFDALRPHTVALWQRLSRAQQRMVVRRFSGLWNVHRHRMAPDVADRIAAELSAGTLVVRAVSGLAATDDDGTLRVTARDRATGEPLALAPAALIDCTGPELRCAHSSQPLLRHLLGDGIATAHHTGLGLIADGRHAVAPRLFALGPLLVGQRWESIAVPELRESADIVTRAIAETLRHPSGPRAARATQTVAAPAR